MAGSAGLFDTLLQSLEGEYTPSELANFVTRVRAAYSSIVDPSSVLQALEPIFFEYAKILADSTTQGFGSGARDVGELFSAIYEYLDATSQTVTTRGITYTAATANGGNIGNAIVRRLVLDRNGYNLEACTVEKKMIRCAADANSGVEQWAETFAIVGETAAFDAVLRSDFGSGDASNTLLKAKHAGTGGGGSLLNNSSFSDFDSSLSTQKFEGWTETFGGAAVIGDVTQDLTNTYRSHPNATTDGALKLAMNSASDQITLKQTINDMRITRLDPNTPYFLRLMYNRSIGSATVGDLTLKLGGNTATSVTLGAQSGWNELVIPFGGAAWLKQFNEEPMDVEISWDGGTAGTLLIDDVLFCPWELVDGTYWIMTYNNGTPTAALVEDFYTVIDTGGAPDVAKLQWWNFVSGLGYFPSSGSPTITDPS